MKAINYNSFTAKQKNLRSIVMIVLLVVVAVVSVVGYSWYTKKQNEDAQAVLAEGIELYQKALKEKSDKILEEAQLAFSIGYERYSGSSLASYFLSFESDILARQGKQDEAIKFMQKSVKKMSNSSPLYNMHKIKLALMKIDSEDEAISKKGKEELSALAGNKKNPDQDLALYHQGLINFNHGNRAEAEKSWKELIDIYGNVSSLAKLAEAKLAYKV